MDVVKFEMSIGGSGVNKTWTCSLGVVNSSSACPMLVNVPGIAEKVMLQSKTWRSLYAEAAVGSSDDAESWQLNDKGELMCKDLTGLARVDNWAMYGGDLNGLWFVASVCGRDIVILERSESDTGVQVCNVRQIVKSHCTTVKPLHLLPAPHIAGKFVVVKEANHNAWEAVEDDILKKNLISSRTATDGSLPNWVSLKKILVTDGAWVNGDIGIHKLIVFNLTHTDKDHRNGRYVMHKQIAELLYNVTSDNLRQFCKGREISIESAMTASHDDVSESKWKTICSIYKATCSGLQSKRARQMKLIWVGGLASLFESTEPFYENLQRDTGNIGLLMVHCLMALDLKVPGSLWNNSMSKAMSSCVLVMVSDDLFPLVDRERDESESDDDNDDDDSEACDTTSKFDWECERWQKVLTMLKDQYISDSTSMLNEFRERSMVTEETAKKSFSFFQRLLKWAFENEAAECIFENISMLLDANEKDEEVTEILMSDPEHLAPQNRFGSLTKAFVEAEVQRLNERGHLDGSPQRTKGKELQGNLVNIVNWLKQRQSTSTITVEEQLQNLARQAKHVGNSLQNSGGKHAPSWTKEVVPVFIKVKEHVYSTYLSSATAIEVNEENHDDLTDCLALLLMIGNGESVTRVGVVRKLQFGRYLQRVEEEAGKVEWKIDYRQPDAELAKKVLEGRLKQWPHKSYKHHKGTYFAVNSVAAELFEKYHGQLEGGSGFVFRKNCFSNELLNETEFSSKWKKAYQRFGGNEAVPPKEMRRAWESEQGLLGKDPVFLRQQREQMVSLHGTRAIRGHYLDSSVGYQRQAESNAELISTMVAAEAEGSAALKGPGGERGENANVFGVCVCDYVWWLSGNQGWVGYVTRAESASRILVEFLDMTKRLKKVGEGRSEGQFQHVEDCGQFVLDYVDGKLINDGKEIVLKRIVEVETVNENNKRMIVPF